MRELMFKANFILWVIVDLSWFGLQLAFVQFLYLQVDTIATWTKWQMILLVATNNLVQQIFQTFLMINCSNLPELVRSGKLDFFLAQPASDGSYTFRVEQTYSDGSIVDWNGSESSEAPAPTIEAKSSLGGGGTSTLEIVAIVLAAIALVVALAGVLAGRGGRAIA